MSKRALVWLIAYLTGVAFTFHEPFWGVATYLIDYYVHPPLQWWGDELPDLRWSLLPASALLASLTRSTPTRPASGPGGRRTLFAGILG